MDEGPLQHMRTLFPAAVDEDLRRVLREKRDDVTKAQEAYSAFLMALGRLQSIFPDAPESDLRRFLLARKGNVTEAEQMYNKHLEWRRATLPVRLTQPMRDELATRKFFQLDGRAKDGSAVAVFYGTRHDSTFQTEQTIEMIIYVIESIFNPAPSQFPSSLPVMESTFSPSPSEHPSLPPSNPASAEDPSPAPVNLAPAEDSSPPPMIESLCNLEPSEDPSPPAPADPSAAEAVSTTGKCCSSLPPTPPPSSCEDIPQKLTLVLFAPSGTPFDVQLIKQLCSVFSDNYPERLSKVLAFPTGPITPMIWNGAKIFMDPVTADKVHLWAGRRPKDLGDFIPTHILPQEFVPEEDRSEAEPRFLPDLSEQTVGHTPSTSDVLTSPPKPLIDKSSASPPQVSPSLSVPHPSSTSSPPASPRQFSPSLPVSLPSPTSSPPASPRQFSPSLPVSLPFSTSSPPASPRQFSPSLPVPLPSSTSSPPASPRQFSPSLPVPLPSSTSSPSPFSTISIAVAIFAFFIFVLGYNGKGFPAPPR